MTGEGTPFDIDPRDKLAKPARSRPYLWLVIALVVLVGGAFVYALYEYEQARIVAGPLLQVRQDGTLLVAWRTAGEKTTQAMVNTAAITGQPAQTQTITPRRVADQYVADLPNLQMAGTSPQYWIQSDMRIFHRTEGPWTIAVPTATTPFRFLVFADSSRLDDPRSLATLMTPLQPHLVLHIGSLVRRPALGPAEAARLYEDQFYDPFDLLVNTVPFMPVMGRDTPQLRAGIPLETVFVLPGNGPVGIESSLSYWFDYGTARFAAIDSDLDAQTLREAVMPWLRQVFSGAQAEWRLVLTEEWTGPGGQALREVLGPVLAEMGVRVVFGGGSPQYARSEPPQAEATGGRMVHVSPGVGTFSVVELAGPRMRVRQIDQAGRTIDEWGLQLRDGR